MGRPKSAWLGFVVLLPLLSSAQQPVPASALAQAGATQSAVPQPSAPLAAAPAAFEVSTVKLSKADNGNSGFNFNNGTFTATNEQLKNIMEPAFGIPQPRIQGGPKWLDSERFDIQAKMESAAAQRLDALSHDQARPEIQAMFQQLLADRFKLAVHWESRELPVYALVVAKRGPLLHASKNAPEQSGNSSNYGMFSANGLTLAEIAEALTQQLSGELGRVVIDKTGIQGRYDLTLKWTPESGMNGSPTQPDAGPSIFTALTEELGLKLESAKGPVKVLVIDHVEMPTDN